MDGNDRFLEQLLNKHRRQGIILAFSTSENIAHLPWELLHDGKSFLVERKPGIIPLRWMSDAQRQLSIEKQPENRALQMLFMATSPLDVQPVLDFEQEEANILEATARQPLALTVEESGCLEELGYLVENYEAGYFDVLHLSGHGTIKDDGVPVFITESLTGESVESTADDIAEELQFQLPKLIFLSGCRTGQASNSGAVPSMAESLLDKGATSVLGWGKKVLDRDAIAAAGALYKTLSAGKSLSEALALTYQALIKNKARDWHLLRLYVGDTLPENLVTPLRTRGRIPAPPSSFHTEFLDAAGTVKVPTRESFVGRRRQLQSCLRSLTLPLLTSPYQGEEIGGSSYQGEEIGGRIGVLIHGMGGLGKSSLAARLCDRLTNFVRIILVGRVDEASLVSRLTDKLDDQNLRETLQNPDEELKFRFKKVFQLLSPGSGGVGGGDLPFLLVLDDFEINLEPRNDSYILKPEAAAVLSALIWAINETYTPHRIIITCRDDFESNHLQYFYKQPLDGMRGADLRKKLSRLAAFNPDKQKSQVDETLKTQAQQLADGNPRLLEWLDKILQSTNVDVAAILNKLKHDPIQLREQVLAKQLLQQMDNTMGSMLQLGLVFELPVPRKALQAICEAIVDLDNYINKAIALGLLEVSPDESLGVPRILPLKLSDRNLNTDNPTTVIATISLTDDNIKTLSKTASQVLYRLWWENAETSTEEQKLEIHRLALLGEETEIAGNLASNIANNWLHKNRYRETVELCKSTLEIIEDYRVLKEMAYCQQQLGEVEQALKNYQQAKKLCPSEDETQTAAICHYFAILEDQQGNVDDAIALLQQSLELYEKIGNLQGKAASLHQLAGIYNQQGNVDDAIALLQQSLELDEKIGDVQGKAASLHQLAGIYNQQGNVDDAIALLQQSLELYEKIGNLQGKAMTLWWLGHIAQQQGDNTTAVEYLQNS